MSPSPLPPDTRKRILFFAECVTLAHFGRMVALAETLDPELYHIGFAATTRYDAFLPSKGWERFPIFSVAPETFQANLAHGKWSHTPDIMERYVREDLETIDAFKPDIVVGDFRLSLGISARVRHVPYVNVINAYWSPRAHSKFSIPEFLPYTHAIPIPIMELVFSLSRPLIFASISYGLNKLRAAYNLKPLPYDLLSIYVDGDVVLYDDVPEIVAVSGEASTSRYLGPISWSLPGKLPEWWRDLPKDRPVILISTGSSGDPKSLGKMLDAIQDRREEFVLVTAGHKLDRPLPANVHCVDYLPLKEAIKDCAAMVSNGGISGYIALSAGVPVLGVARNLDQFLCSGHLEATQAGLTLRGDTFTSVDFNQALDKLLTDSHYRANAKKCADLFAPYNYRKIFPDVVGKLIPNELPVSEVIQLSRVGI